MTDPMTVMDAIATDACDLDTLGKDMDAAVNELNQAEFEWDREWDAVAEALRDEYREAGRKSDPAEHVILSATRREHRTKYTRLRNAKREVEKLERMIQAKRAAISGRQSELGALRDEARAGNFDRPAVQTFGARRAA